jgi:hypothetical protein
MRYIPDLTTYSLSVCISPAQLSNGRAVFAGASHLREQHCCNSLVAAGQGTGYQSQNVAERRIGCVGQAARSWRAERNFPRLVEDLAVPVAG